MGGSPIRTARSGHTLRGHLLHHFPFTVVVAVRPEELVVIAVAHHKRTPGYWRDRLKRLK